VLKFFVQQPVHVLPNFPFLVNLRASMWAHLDTETAAERPSEAFEFKDLLQGRRSNRDANNNSRGPAISPIGHAIGPTDF
jgi:hypothetical protein